MMKFEKLDNGALRCVLTKEDLEEYGMELEDFFSNSALAREFLEKLMHMAEDEVGFQTTGNMISIQAAIMSENEIVLTFSENQVSGSELIEHLKNMFGSNLAKEKVPIAQKQTEDIFNEIGKDTKEEKIAGDMEGYAYLLTFVSFAGVRDFCRILRVNESAKSCLYYLEQKKKYYLWADLNNSTRKFVYEFVAASMEYAQGIEKDSAYRTYLEEHGKTIIKEQALEVLAHL